MTDAAMDRLHAHHCRRWWLANGLCNLLRVQRLAALTGRVQSNVSRSLQQLAQHGLVRLVQEGKEVRPLPAASALAIDLMAGTYRTVPLGTAGG
jgi:DNA-binding transcriptional ArsR family regulator